MREAFGEDVEGHSVGRVSKGKGKSKAKRGRMGPPVEKGWLEKWRLQLKIASVSTSCCHPCALLMLACIVEAVLSFDGDATDAASEHSGCAAHESL